MGLVHVARGRRDYDKALSLLDDWLEGQEGVAAFPPRMALNYLEVCTVTGNVEHAAEVAAGISLDDSDLNDLELLRLSTAADKLGLSGVIVRVIERLSRLETLSLSAALNLLQMAGATGQKDIIAQVRSELLVRVAHRDAAELAVEIERQEGGPISALKVAREMTGPRRDLQQSIMLAETLLDAAEPHLALRYLKFCRRRWAAPEIRRLLVTAFIACGEPEAAGSEIATWQDDMPPNAKSEATIALASALGDIRQLKFGLDNFEGRRAMPQLRLQVCFAENDLEGAEILVPSVCASMGRGRQVMAHFSVTHVGSVLNEMRLWKHFGRDPARGARAFYFAAREILQDQQPRLSRLARSADGLGSAIPPTVTQYWDSDSVPAAVSQIMESWKSCKEISYRRYSKATAMDFLQRHFGDDHVRAFRLANHPAEESDFFRLCLLLHEGGIYADADDRLTGPISLLLERRRGILLFWEKFGAVANNLICSRPGHPIIAIAKDLALASLLARENDGPWSKTGPGLMTRAVATFLLSASDAEVERDVEILPEIEMWKVVYPHIKLSYKKTPKYWDSRFGGGGPAIARALREKFGSGVDENDVEHRVASATP